MLGIELGANDGATLGIALGVEDGVMLGADGDAVGECDGTLVGVYV